MSQCIVENINLYVLVKYLGIFHCIWASVPHQGGERGVIIIIIVHFHININQCVIKIIKDVFLTTAL